jgi:acetoacetate decarboxylase
MLIQVPFTSIGQKFGEIVPWNYIGGDGEYVYIVYLDGIVPIKIKSNISKDEFENMGF